MNTKWFSLICPYALLSLSLLTACPTPDDADVDAGHDETHHLTDSGVDPARDGGTPIQQSDGGNGFGQQADGGREDGGQEDGGQLIEEDAGPTSLPLPNFSHFEALIDAHRGDADVWATFLHLTPDGDGWNEARHTYQETGDQHDFWPASVIKIYPAVSALELIKEWNVSLDAEVSFYHRGDGDDWTFDITRSVRDMIHGSFNCSSNTDYTLLLRLAGMDWMNTNFLTPDKGFLSSALMRGYISDRPWVYERDEEQLVLITEDTTSIERTHQWSGYSFADDRGCTIYNTAGTANCSTPDDMVEVMRRIVFHEALPEDEKYDVRLEDLVWLRDGGDTLQMSNKSCSTPWEGIRNVMPEAELHHKGGLVSQYALGVHHVYDVETNARYILALVTKSTSTALLKTLSEEIARMALTPRHYVHLDYLQDYVNPITAELMVYSEHEGSLELIVKDEAQDATDPSGWETLPGTQVSVPSGLSWHSLQSSCLEEDITYHIKGSLDDLDDGTNATSDLHYVIVDADLQCTDNE